MANITQVEINGTTYDICDATARDSINDLNNSILLPEKHVKDVEFWYWGTDSLQIRFDTYNGSSYFLALGWDGISWQVIRSGETSPTTLWTFRK